MSARRFGRATAAWSPAEEALAARLLRAGLPAREVARRLGRSEGAIRTRAPRLCPERAGRRGRPRLYRACETRPDLGTGIRATPGCGCEVCQEKRRLRQAERRR